jgi:hypothetical protein
MKNIPFKYTLALLFLIGFIIGLFIVRQYGPQAEAQDTPPAPASAAFAEIQRLAPAHDSCIVTEREWEQAKKIITEVYGCRIAGDRSAMDCSPLE